MNNLVDYQLLQFDVMKALHIKHKRPELLHYALGRGLRPGITITDNEEHVLRRRFALEGDIAPSYEQLGTEMNLTSAKIRTLEEKALRKVRRIVRFSK